MPEEEGEEPANHGEPRCSYVACCQGVEDFGGREGAPAGIGGLREVKDQENVAEVKMNG